MKETFPYTDYVVLETRQSTIDPHKTLEVETGFHCPRCKTVLKKLEHGDNRICTTCSLVSELWGNGLECYEIGDDESQE